MDIQKIAQSLIDNLNTELKEKEASIAELKGAMLGINLLFNNIVDAMKEKENVDNRPVQEKKKSGKK